MADATEESMEPFPAAGSIETLEDVAPDTTEVVDDADDPV